MAEAVEKFEKYLYTRGDLLSVLQSELKGKVLGCWCKNKPSDGCHGDVLARLADTVSADEIQKLVAAAPTAPAAPLVPGKIKKNLAKFKSEAKSKSKASKAKSAAAAADDETRRTRPEDAAN